MYELTVKFEDKKRIEVYGRLVEVTDRIAVLFFQKGSSLTVIIKQIEGDLYEGVLNQNK